MNWFKNLKIRNKLLLGFAVVVATMIAQAYLSYAALASMQTVEREEVAPAAAALVQIASVVQLEHAIRKTTLAYITYRDPTQRAGFKRDLEAQVTEATVGLTALKARIEAHMPTERALMASIDKEISTYRSGREREFELVAAGKDDEAVAASGGEQARQHAAILADLGKLQTNIEAVHQAAVAESTRVFDVAGRQLAAVGVAAVLLALIIVQLLNALLAVPLREVRRIANAVAGGDLTVTVAVDARADELGELQRALATMVDSLRAQARQLQEGFGILAAAASEILATATQVATGATETATAVSETSATVEEVKQTAHLAVQKAGAVMDASRKAAAVAQTGLKAVEGTVAGMGRIREQMEGIAGTVVRLAEQGQTIGEIIATVSDLAEQSNLLAVNAAIEAARAGEHGRGFSVVAQEVRSLAEQSREATAQIRTILMDIQKATSAAVMTTEQGTKAVALGVQQSADAGESIRALAAGVAEAAQAGTQIAASSQQQLIGMDQVAVAIGNIRGAASQNMSGTKQLEESARSLHVLGTKLKALVDAERLAT